MGVFQVGGCVLEGGAGLLVEVEKEKSKFLSACALCIPRSRWVGGEPGDWGAGLSIPETAPAADVRACCHDDRLSSPSCVHQLNARMAILAHVPSNMLTSSCCQAKSLLLRFRDKLSAEAAPRAVCARACLQNISWQHRHDWLASMANDACK